MAGPLRIERLNVAPDAQVVRHQRACSDGEAWLAMARAILEIAPAAALLHLIFIAAKGRLANGRRLNSCLKISQKNFSARSRTSAGRAGSRKRTSKRRCVKFAW